MTLTPTEKAGTAIALQNLLRSRQAVFNQLMREGKVDLAEGLKEQQEHDQRLLKRLQSELKNKEVLA